MADIIFHCMGIESFVYPFISWRAFGVFPLFGYYESCRYEHLYTNFYIALGFISRSEITGSYDNCAKHVKELLNCFSFF